mgnify:CR=1 FL=1
MSTTYRRSPAAIWRASEQLLVAAVPPDAPTRMAGSASLVWQWLARPITLDDLVGALVEHTGVDAGVIQRDVQGLLDALVPLRLVEVME